MKKNKEKKTKVDISHEWEDLYKSEEKKFKKYLEATQISNATESFQKLIPPPSATQVLTRY